MRRPLVFLLLAILCSPLFSQRFIKNLDGYDPQIGALISMMDDLKGRVTRNVQDLNQEQTDFLLDENANRIGALILHLAATEVIYQKLTFYNEMFDEEDEADAEWIIAMDLGDKGREVLQGKDISYYLDKWSEVRSKTKELLKTKNDTWLMEERMFPNSDVSYNNYWAWYHVMEHQANHMGQMVLIRKRLDAE